MRKRSWTEEELKKATSKSRSYRHILHLLHLKEAGGNYTQIKKYLREYHIDTSHLKGKAWNKGMKGLGRVHISLEQILVENSEFQSYKLKKRLFQQKLRPEHCELCGWAERSVDGRLPLELDHINGNHRDNRLNNLRILCPNCHSLQITHRGKNRGIIHT
ncbi:MAG: HNH endonuclease [Candidatus Gottesmanbacteria bacterium]|nr:HNH endonuclease [Candidatus Gottesmanbacteria bacterium]